MFKCTFIIFSAFWIFSFGANANVNCPHENATSDYVTLSDCDEDSYGGNDVYIPIVAVPGIYPEGHQFDLFSDADNTPLIASTSSGPRWGEDMEDYVRYVSSTVTTHNDEIYERDARRRFQANECFKKHDLMSEMEEIRLNGSWMDDDWSAFLSLKKTSGGSTEIYIVASMVSIIIEYILPNGDGASFTCAVPVEMHAFLNENPSDAKESLSEEASAKADEYMGAFRFWGSDDENREQAEALAVMHFDNFLGRINDDSFEVLAPVVLGLD